MNVIYVGTVPPSHIVQEIKELGSYMDNATLTFQSALVSGLDYWFPNMRVVSGIRVDEFPKVKKLYFNPESFSHKGSPRKEDYFVGVFNMPIFKRLFSFFYIRKGIKKVLESDDKNVVIMYSMPSNQLLAVVSLRKHLHKSCLIVPDLPEFMSVSKTWIRRCAKAIDRKIINWCVRRIDVFALLSQHMSERLPIEGKKWTQVEGIFDNRFKDVIPLDEYKQYHSILYSGDLGLRYGIKDLLDAFMLIKDSNYRLVICGTGDGVKLVKEYADTDSRINYLGTIERSKVLSLQRGVTVLVNPRYKSEEYTRYSFPSKTMEYLASGTPVIMHHLDCIPKEYDEYINYIDEETPESLRDKILEVCETDKSLLDEQGKKARQFILDQKNAIIQTKKIVDLIPD